MSEGEAADFTSSLTCLVEPSSAALSEQLACVRGLTDSERAAIREGLAASLRETLLRKVNRVLILELNAARITGELTAGDSAARWSQFLRMSATTQYWESLSEYYPTMLPRLDTLITRRCAAVLAMAERLSADREALTPLLGSELGALSQVTIGAGDSHRGGQTVALLRFAAGTVVYKPRAVHVDAVLNDLLAKVLTGVRPDARIRVPQVLSRGDYGWAEYVPHRFCAGHEELSSFYRGMGHWLGVMRLLGGSDLHAENVIACGPVPVVVDCETLFTPAYPPRPSGFGRAIDKASALVQATVLRTGMLPSRGIGLSWRGVDISAAGSLRGEQPVTDLAVIVDAGRDTARFGYEPARLEIGASHPSPVPVLADYWDQVLAGFSEVTARLRAMDQDAGLAPLLASFRDCPIRVVPRSTEAYAEIARMLWHPVSLNDPGAAADRAAGLLATMAEHVLGAPDDPRVIAAEVADLTEGDIPFFATTPGYGRLAGPGGTSWLPEQDLIADALDRWRTADLDMDHLVIRAALVSAYLNDGWMPGERRMRTVQIRLEGLERRRRDTVAALLGQLRDTAIQAEDGTVTWIAPVLHPTGWSVQPLGVDSYGGMPGVSVLLASYQRECAAGRADKVAGIDEVLTAALRTWRMAEDRLDAARRSGTPMRPPPPGGYIGLGSQIWAWLALHRLGVAGPDALARAEALASQVPAAVDAWDGSELLTGSAGAIVPLLQLAAVTQEACWTRHAAAIGEQLVEAARRTGDTACWPSRTWPDGIGGFAHGATGIGWALARLALATGEERLAEAARAAFAFEETLYDRTGGGWRDMREPEEKAYPVAWCHGAVGIGISTADLLARGWPEGEDRLRRAVAIADRDGFGWNHTLCHGDFGCWELLAGAVNAGYGPVGLTRPALDARVIGSLEANQPVTGLARDAYSPGLMAGQGGMIYQLLRLNQDCDLPSVLTLGDPV
jgi:type 2 lantibiotic biosynthesis protein LanM